MISKEIRERSKKDIVINKTNLEKELIDHTLTHDGYIREANDVLRAFNKAQAEFDKAYEKTFNELKFSKENDNLLSDREYERKAKVQTATLKDRVQDLEADYAWYRDYMENFKQRYWSIKTLIEYQQFLDGGKSK